MNATNPRCNGESAAMPQQGLTIDMTVEDDQWATLDPDLKLTDRFVEYGLAAIAAAFPQLPAAELSVVLTDDVRMRALNGAYRGKDRATNVLSFGHLDGGRQLRPVGVGQPYPLGDIVLSYGTIDREAKAQGKPTLNHVAHLFIHGVLHLLGYTHDGTDDAAQMEAMEIGILNGFHIPNPYDILPQLLSEGPRV